jgi:hypothetical protein
MDYTRRFGPAVVLLAMSAAVCSAQSITAARSGTLHYSEGDVSIDGTPYEAKVSKFPEIKEQSVLSTGKGRAEVLLTPGVFLRMGEDSSIRMLDTRLTSTRVDVLSGMVTLESDDPQMSVKNSPVTLLYKDYEIRMLTHGLVEITSDPSQMKVFKGEAEVATADNRVVVRDGHLLPFSAGLTTEKFDGKTGDDLYLWTRDRSGDLSAANMSSARTLSSGSGYGFANGSGSGAWNGGWYFNPFFDMYTYVPGAGTMWNPFGYGFFSPATIYGYYAPTNYWYGGARGAVSGQPLPTINGPTTKLAAPLSSLRAGNIASSSSISSPLRGVSAPAPAMAGAASGASRGGSAAGSISSGMASARGSSRGR